jgi:cytochrome c oxidase cbb3-type subunit 3
MTRIRLLVRRAPAGAVSLRATALGATALGALLLGGAACARERPAERGAPTAAAPATVVRTSDLVAGGVAPVVSRRNPYQGSTTAVAEGKRLYESFNCGGCHGGAGGGGIGPPFADQEWIYGSDPANIYQSIVQGRPNGMPSFGARLPPEVIWRIVAYVRTLGGVPPEGEDPGSTGGAAGGGGGRATGREREERPGG